MWESQLLLKITNIPSPICTLGRGMNDPLDMNEGNVGRALAKTPEKTFRNYLNSISQDVFIHFCNKKICLFCWHQYRSVRVFLWHWSSVCKRIGWPHAWPCWCLFCQPLRKNNDSLILPLMSPTHAHLQQLLSPHLLWLHVHYNSVQQVQYHVSV